MKSTAIMDRKLKTAVFTIISNNYAAHARVLMKSLMRHEPDLHRFVLVVDKDDQEHRIPDHYATSINVNRLALPEPDWFFIKYNLLEADTAVKPWMFEHLFKQGFDCVIYLDPDIKIYSEMRELKDALSASEMVLTPHITEPYQDSAVPGDLDIRRSGIYNLGFLALRRGETSRRAIEWWKARCSDNCRISFEEGMFVDQSWMDFAPALFPNAHILRHTGYNVAYWNIHYRSVSFNTRRNEAPLMNDGSPLRFFHFSGSNPAKPQVLSKHQNRIREGFMPSWLTAIMNEYFSDLKREGYESTKDIPCRLGLLGERDVPDWLRKTISRSPVLKGVFSSGGRPPGPLKVIREYLNMPDGRIPRIPVFLAELHRQRIDVRSSIREHDEDFVQKLVSWFRNSGRTEMNLGNLFNDEGWWSDSRAETVQNQSAGREKKINVYGYFLGQLGLGESARATGRALKQLKHPFRAVNYSEGSQSPTIHCDFSLSLPYRNPDLEIIHINCDQLAKFFALNKDVLNRSSYKIGFWSWELESKPPYFDEAVQYVDEIWCPSESNRACFQRLTDKPVRVVAHNVKQNRSASGRRALRAKLPEVDFNGTCVYLTCCDFFSCPERKNPEGALRAYLRAFPRPDGRTNLIVKISNPSARLDYLEMLEQLRRGRKDIVIFTSTLDHGEMSALIDSSTALISLHRNEGFGLPIAEAISYRKPAVVTAYGGNLDFCNGRNSRLVGYKLTKIRRDLDAYKKGSFWADPDIDEAAGHLTSIFQAWTRGSYRHRNLFSNSINRRSTMMYSKALREAAKRASDRIADPSSANRRRPPHKILIFGAGSAGVQAFRALSASHSILAFIDSDPRKRGQMLEGYPIISPADIKDYEYDRIMIASMYRDEIYAQLTRTGIAPASISSAIY